MTSKRELATVQQFVAGTMPLGLFVQLLHRNVPLREYLAKGGGVDEFVSKDLLGTLLRFSWQDMADVHAAHQLLERLLRAQGIDVKPTDRYSQRVELAEKLAPLMAKVQEPWLKIPVPYFALLLKECTAETDGDVEDLMRRRVANRFRSLADPPQWLHEEYWPVGRHGPLVFVTQLEVAPDRPGTAVNYVFVDPRDGSFLVVPQVAGEPGTEPTPAAVSLPRGVVPVFSRPGAFWLKHPQRPAPTAEDTTSRDTESQDLPAAPVAQAAAPAQVPAPADEPKAPAAEPTAKAAAPKADPEPVVAAPAVPQTKVVADPLPPYLPDAPGGIGTLPDLAPVGLPATKSVPDRMPPYLADAPGMPSTVPVADNLEASGWPLLPSTLPGSASGDDLEPTVMTTMRVFSSWTMALADGRSFSLQSPSVLVGRRPYTTEAGVQALSIVDTTRSLSKTHARMDLVGGTWQVTDLNSTNGVVVTTIDGQEKKAEPGQPIAVYGYIAFGSVEARLHPDHFE
ncbi:MAG: FHA domain-containing protein [Micrococcales bacterium]|nr:FHA domain-containing protein [Micrococcales bacterium]